MANRGLRRGFTLIELLVVIAIIAILAGILFPVFAKAREKAEQTDCVSNLKQIAMSMQMYASDYSQKLPVFVYAPNPAGVYRAGNYLWPYVLLPYTKNQQVFNCKSMPIDQNYDGGKQPRRNAAGISYLYNRFRPERRATPMSRIGYPASTVLLCDGAENGTMEPAITMNWNGLPFNAGMYGQVGAVSIVNSEVRANHGGDEATPPAPDTGLSVTAFVDGHAKALPMGALTKTGKGVDGCLWPASR